MERRKTFRTMLTVAGTEYIKWLTQPRNIIVGILLIMIYSLITGTLIQRADKFGSILSVGEPFIAIGNSGMTVLFIPCVFLVLMSDYPRINSNVLLIFRRTGSRGWILGHLLFAFMAATTFVAVICLFSIITSHGTLEWRWSDVITKYDLAFPEERDNFASQLIPSNLYNQLNMGEAFCHTIIFIILYITTLTLCLYLFKMLYMRIMGIVTVYAIVAAGVLTCSFKLKIMWIFPMANSLIWLHYDRILSAKKYPMWASYLYFAIIILILGIVDVIVAERLEFTNVEHEEE